MSCKYSSILLNLFISCVKKEKTCRDKCFNDYLVLLPYEDSDNYA